MEMMGHHLAKMGHHFVQMGHEGTPMEIRMVSLFVMVKPCAGGAVSARFLEAKWLENRLKVA